MTHRGYKVRQQQTKRKEQSHPIGDKDRTSLNTKMQLDRHLHLNWSNFKPEFSRKQEEDAEAQLLHSNDCVTQWWCSTTTPGTLGVTRHLLGLVSLGM